jgi:LacI family transcriptional regulator
VRITIAEIAKQAGVAKSTVSRVLNGKPDVDEATAERVRRIVEQTGYVPSAGAVGLARGRTRTVAMLLPSLAWLWVAAVVQGVAEELETEGYGLLLFTMTRGQESLTQFETQVSANAFDGLIAIEPPNTLDYIAGLHAAGLPVVLIDDRGHHPEFPSVVTTDRAGSRAAAAHLLASGRRRLAVITGPAEYGAVRDRSRGFREGLAEADVELDEALVVAGDFCEEGGFAAANTLLDARVPFDGLFAHNDLMAIGALRALRDAGVAVPSDVAVVGFDDLPLAAHTEPPLTTVHQPRYEMGGRAARMLLDHLAGTPMPTDPVVLDTSLVIRRSAPTPAGNAATSA